MKIIEGGSLSRNFFRGMGKEDDRVSARVKRIVHDIRTNGDRALLKYTRQFDRVSLKEIRVRPSEIERAQKKADPRYMRAIKAAAKNIRKFSQCQAGQVKPLRIQIAPGVTAGQTVIPIQRVGIYVPAGRYPLVSSLLMCAVPALVAGVKEVAVCSPPDKDGRIDPLILAAAGSLGIKEIYKAGGAQAVAAMAYGTRWIKKVDKIVGPGNRYVTRAKKEVYGAVGIDFAAGPSEIMIIADKHADAGIVAADLLAQAEHDTCAGAWLVTDSRELAILVKKETARQLRTLKTRATAEASLLKNGLIILVNDIAEAVEIANRKAPEHLELQVRNAPAPVKNFKNYGSLFIGSRAAEVLGDYSSGINHTLPTGGAARYTGGLGVRDFLKFQTTLKVTKRGLKSIGGIAERLARIEGLDGHAKAVRARVE